MALDVDAFARLRPFLYHLTAAANVPGIQAVGGLQPASHALRVARRNVMPQLKRTDHLDIAVGGYTISLRDQKPLHELNAELQGGWSFSDLVAALNQRVFFWPGSSHGPSDYGERHFARYASEQPIILRAPTVDVFRENTTVVPEFCRFNSGSPRWTAGRPSPRGPRTFLPATEFEATCGSVVEVVFANEIRLPHSTTFGASPQGPWQPLMGKVT